MKERFCRFNARVTKAYVDDSTGLKTIEAVASDDKLDWYKERFTEEAIDDMVSAARQRKALKPEEGLVGLQRSHYEVFEIGYAVNGEKVDNLENKSKEFRVKLALKDGWSEAEELYKDVLAGRIDKQLSVGGLIPDWDNDYEIREEPFTNEDGEEIMIPVGIIKRFKLEHIAVTSPNGAANPRTRFETSKSKGYKNGSVYKSATDEAYQARFVKTQTVDVDDEKTLKTMLKNVGEVVRDTMNKVFKEREDEQMKIVEKAKKRIEELRKLVDENADELDAETLKSLGFNFVEETEEQIETEETEEVEVVTEEVVKGKIDALTEDFEAKLEVVKGLIPEKVEIPEIPEDQSEKVKALEKTVEDLTKRLKALEAEDTGTQTDETDVEDIEDIEEEVVESDPNDKLAAWR